MEVTGEKVIIAPQARVYDALHDPVILRQAIPGVPTLSIGDDGRYHITAALRVGPLRPIFTGTVAVYNADRPAGYSLRGEALAGAAGAASGSAHVALAAVDAETTNLAYYVTADLTGGIEATEGVRTDVLARMLVAEFFARLQSILDGEVLEADAPVALPGAHAAASRPGPIASGPLPVAVADTGERPPRDRPDSGDARSDARPMRRTAEASTTDATGCLAAGAAPDAGPLTERLVGTLPQTPYRPPYRTGYEATDSVVDDGRGAGVGRWVAAALGVVAIALLLNNGFSGI